MSALLLDLAGQPLERVSSTQDRARELAEAGAPEGTTIRALEQTRGRGRGAHTWHSARGLGLWMSFVLRPRIEPRYWPGLTALLSLETARALEIDAPSGFRTWVKWPNDLVGSRGKLGGVLAETAGGGVVLGLGVNLGHDEADFPPSLRGLASSLRIEGFARTPDALAVLGRLNEGLTAAYRRYQNGDRTFLAEGLKERFYLRDRRVRVLQGPGSAVAEGIARNVGEQGELILETPEGERHLFGGEVLSVGPREEDG